MELKPFWRLLTMPSETPNLKTRIKTLNAVLTRKKDQQIVGKALRASEGDFTEALKYLKDKLTDTSLEKLVFADSLAELAGDHVALVKALADKPEITSLRDVALHFNTDKLAELVDPNAVPENIPGATLEQKKKNFALRLQHKLFNAETTAVLHRMVQEAEIPIVDINVRSGVTSFLSNQPEFNIRTTSVYTAFKQPKAFKGIAAEHRSAIADQLKTLQRVQAISPVPEAVPVLFKQNLTSAFRVAEMPESTFVNAFGAALGEDVARQVYTNAIDAHIRNTHALM